MVNQDRNKDKKILKVDDKEDYEKSGFKSIMENVEETKKQALESVPQIPGEQIPVEKRSQKTYWVVTQRIRKRLRST